MTVDDVHLTAVDEPPREGALRPRHAATFRARLCRARRAGERTHSAVGAVPYVWGDALDELEHCGSGGGCLTAGC
jgi:hypothetical protein